MKTVCSVIEARHKRTRTAGPHFREAAGGVRLIGTESGLEAVSGCGEVGMGRWSLLGMVLVWGDENVLEMNSGDPA